MIGLIAAEKEETANLIKTIKARIIEFNGIKYYVGAINDKQVIVTFCGMGKTNAAMCAMNMIANFGVKQIFNIGLCGACKQNIAPGSILIADSLEYSDVDLTAFNYPLNQLPEEPMQFEIKKEYVDILKTFVKNPIIGTIASADSIISIKNVEAFPSVGNKHIVGFDMESTAIAHVCHKTKVDFLCMKIVSDNLSFDKSSREQYDNSYKTIPKQIANICLKVLEYYSK